MSRRTNQLFSLSLLDLLTSALGAIIFLFIITPKGGASASKVRQAMVYFDTTQMKIHGQLPDSLLTKMAGDTMQMVLLAYKDLPQIKQPKPEKKYTYNEPRPKPAKEPKPRPKPVVIEKPVPEPKPKEEPKKQPTPKPDPPKKAEPEKTKPPVYRGDAPSVPANVSFEVNWSDKEDNIDLFVCKGNDCVYGGRKKDKKIGQWDSGKSRNRIFGNDLRTNQEAVRQFDKIIPGEYEIYVQFKNSKKNSTTVDINGLIYTKDPKTRKERGEAFSRTLKLGDGRILVGTVILKADGSYTIKGA